MHPPLAVYHKLLTEDYAAEKGTPDYVRNSCIIAMGQSIEALEKENAVMKSILGMLAEDFKARQAAPTEAPKAAANASAVPPAPPTPGVSEDEDDTSDLPKPKVAVTNSQKVVNIPAPAKVVASVSTNGGVVSSSPSAQS